MSARLVNRVAVITGSSSGIGRACATLFAAEGAKIVVNGFPEEAGRQVVKDIRAQGGLAAYHPADVRRSEDITQLIQFAVDTFGSVDILMNNAFCGESASVLEQEEDDWDEVYAASVKATYLGCKYAIPLMQKAGGGSIINTSSVHGLLGSNRNAAYDSAKAAMLNLTRQIAVEYGPSGIRVNSICPGWIATDEHMKWREENPDKDQRQKIIYPLGRPGRMREVAMAALFLASDEASFITGHALVVDGGLTCQLQDALAIRMEKSVRAELRPKTE